MRNRWQLFKETTVVVKLFCTLLAYTAAHLIYFLCKYLSVRPVDQWIRKMEVTSCSRCCIMGSGVDILAWKINLAMTVVVESWITHCSLDPMVSTK